MYLTKSKGIFDKEARMLLTIKRSWRLYHHVNFGYESFKVLEQRETLFFAMNLFGTTALIMIGVYDMKKESNASAFLEYLSESQTDV